MDKSCVSCKESKSPDRFHNDKNTKDGKTTTCKDCANSRARMWASKNMGRIVQKKRERRKRDLQGCLLESAQNRANINNIPLSIVKEDIIIPERCPVLGILLRRNTGKAAADSPTVDRLIPELGYVKGNIQVISYKANKMKNNASVEELILFSKWVLNKWEKNSAESV